MLLHVGVYSIGYIRECVRSIIYCVCAIVYVCEIESYTVVNFVVPSNVFLIKSVWVFFTDMYLMK